jgi:hypothetical protein
MKVTNSCTWGVRCMHACREWGHLIPLFWKMSKRCCLQAMLAGNISCDVLTFWCDATLDSLWEMPFSKFCFLGGFGTKMLKCVNNWSQDSQSMPRFTSFVFVFENTSPHRRILPVERPVHWSHVTPSSIWTKKNSCFMLRMPAPMCLP